MKAQNVIIDGATLYYTNEDITDASTDLATIVNSYFCTAKTGVNIVVKPILKSIEYQGKLGRKVKGDTRVLGWEVSAECEVLDFNDAILTASLLEKKTGGANHDKYVPKADIEETDYKNLVVVGKMKGKTEPVICVIKNTYNAEGLAFTMEDNNEAGNKLKFEGSYDDETVPFEKYVPKTV